MAWFENLKNPENPENPSTADRLLSIDSLRRER